MAKSKRKTHRLSHADAVMYGSRGGSPILLSWRNKRAVKGYKVVRTTK